MRMEVGIDILDPVYMNHNLPCQTGSIDKLLFAWKWASPGGANYPILSAGDRIVKWRVRVLQPIGLQTEPCGMNPMT